MSTHHGSKSMNTLVRLRQQNTKNDDNDYNEEDLLHHNTNEEKHNDYDYHATILKNNNNDHVHCNSSSFFPKETVSTNEEDLYTPLSPEEADEDQL
eukprot:CAMPEP_0170879746 /NCGR_PEP_ID=MMETSP0734-20130129/31950_1 /TAXON_ID=186038 /ORGANISM="Fragilariopsis kerguelensis, Strain L26-C5" /LENGTH=95 /DNA_ID=CAMNT_0011262991 /DNA_START=56 /DNA_END=339 /DNA_ORIENTATION=+